MDDKPAEFNELKIDFVFVPYGDPEPTEWMARHTGWVKFPATFVPRRTAPGVASTRPEWGASAPQIAEDDTPVRQNLPGADAPATHDDPIAAFLRVNAALVSPGEPASGAASVRPGAQFLAAGHAQPIGTAGRRAPTTGMAVSAEFLRWSALAMLSVMLTVPAHAQTNSREFNLGSIVPTPVAVEDALQRARTAHCITADCVALDTIFGTYQIIGDSTATPTRMGGWTPTTAKEAFLLTQPATIKRRLRATLLSHPDRFAAICARAENLAAHYDPDAGVKQGDEYFFANSLIQMIMLIDTKGPEHCLSRVLAALPPPSPPNDLVRGAREFCVGAQWHSAGCKRIRR